MARQKLDTSDSECFAKVERDSNSGETTLTFNKGKTKVHKLKLDKEQWEAFEKAGSKGGHFNDNIK